MVRTTCEHDDCMGVFGADMGQPLAGCVGLSIVNFEKLLEPTDHRVDWRSFLGGPKRLKVVGGLGCHAGSPHF